MTHLPSGNYTIGDDVTELLHITKYEPQEEVQQDDAEPKSQKKVSKFRQWMFRCPVTAGLAQQIWGNSIKRKSFPDFIAKTDETRIQSMPFMLNRKDITFEAHEKVDGQSGTFFLRKYKKLFGLRTEYDFGVCSRNLRLFREDSSSYWSVVNRYHIRDALRKLLDDCKDGSEWVCIHGECVAPSVQGNKYHVDKPDLYCFNLITEKRGKIDSLEAEEILRPYGLKWVPLEKPTIACRIPFKRLRRMLTAIRNCIRRCVKALSSVITKRVSPLSVSIRFSCSSGRSKNNG